jgi:hypothetical protein
MLSDSREWAVIALARFLAALNGEAQPCVFVTGRRGVLRLRVLPWPLGDFVAWMAHNPSVEKGWP